MLMIFPINSYWIEILASTKAHRELVRLILFAIIILNR